MNCDFCLRPPQQAAFIVACVVCKQRNPCCRECWRTYERGARHCEVEHGPLREIVADVDGRYVTERKKDAGEEGVTACKPFLSVRVLLWPDKIPIEGARVELHRTSESGVTDVDGMYMFGEVSNRQPTVSGSKRGYRSPTGGEYAVFSCEARRVELERDTVITLLLTFHCPGLLTPTIKLANADTVLQRAELEEAFTNAGAERRSLEELGDLLAQMRVELEKELEKAAQLKMKDRCAQALTALDEYWTQFQAFYESDEYDDTDKEEALNAAIALVQTLLKPAGEPTLQDVAVEHLEKLQGHKEARLIEIEAHEKDAATTIEEAEKSIAVRDGEIELLQGEIDQKSAQAEDYDAFVQTKQARLAEAKKRREAAISRIDKAKTNLATNVDNKLLEVELCDQAMQAITENAADDHRLLEEIERAKKVLSRRRVSGPPQVWDHPAALLNQLKKRLDELADRREQGPIVATPDLSRFDRTVRWRLYERLCAELDAGCTIFDLMNICDVWARRTGAANDASVVGVHEVDGAFIPDVRGITEVRIVPKKGSAGYKFIGGGGMGEKVFAFGCGGALDFRSTFQKREERFYAVLLPPGFTFGLGEDVRKKGISGASAREPSFGDFRAHTFRDPLQGNPSTNVPIDPGHLFCIRAEESTADGQITIHFGFRQMRINGRMMSMVDFIRAFVIGVVEFDRNGLILQYQLFRP